MNDELTMDRKVYVLPPPSKSSLQEQSNRPSRQQDGAGSSQTSKNYSRPSNRRREPLFGSTYGPNTRGDPIGRKPTSQKSKTVDKRSRNRGNDNTTAVVRQNDEPEMGSIQAPGGKKQNMNHLLNFHFAPRETQVFSGSWNSHNTHPGGNKRSSVFGGALHRPKFNKEQFLQANCQFMVKSVGDYTVYKSDPDLLVEWNSVEQIFIRTIGETPHCPICLAPPVAAKMTRCGHIFCWPCMLHYLALSDKQFRKCPICYEPVHKDDLKSVVSKVCKDVQVGDDIKMQLMCRPKDSTVSMPLVCKTGTSIEWESVFSKLQDVTPSQVLDKVISREKCELTQLLLEDQHCPEACFVEQSLLELGERRTALLNAAMGIASQERSVDVVASSLGLNPNDWKQPEMPYECETKEDDSSKNVKKNEDNLRCDYLGGGSDEGHYMFYQALDGQNVFLHPLNMTMLWKGFGEDPSQWPQILQLKVIEKEFMTMTEDMKKRLKFLRHLPITTSFHLVEVEIKPPMVSESIVSEFVMQLDIRKKRRAHRAREERRRERLREAEERKKLNYCPPCPKIESKLDFPYCGKNEEFEGYEEMLLASLVESNPYADDMNSYFDNHDTNRDEKDIGLMPIPIKTPPNQPEPSVSSTPPSVSFAQVVSQKPTVRRSTTYPGGRASNPLTTKCQQVSGGSKSFDGEHESEDYVPVPEFRNSVTDAIAKAFADVHVNHGNESNSSGQKKKKKKGKVLFSTGMGGLQ